MSKKEEMKLRVSNEIELIKSNSANSNQDFKKYLEENELTKKAINHLFTEGTEEKQKIYINTVFPAPGRPEFKKYQRLVMKLGDRRTLATYYMYYEVSANGEIELINRAEVNPFIYYINNHNLSEKAFKFLIKNGSPELIEAYLTNKDVPRELMPMFVKNATAQDIFWYFCSSISEEKDVVIACIKKHASPSLINKLSSLSEMMSLLLS